MDLDRLEASTPENLIRLARWLGLRTDNKTHEQIARFIYWHLRDKGGMY